MRLSAQNLTLERGGRRLFSGLSFAVESGTALLVTGPNGAGKSSLLRALAGFLSLGEGAFALEGGDPELTVAEQSHYLGHLDALKGALTAAENLAFWAGMLGGTPTADSIRNALAQVGLVHVADFPVRSLSAGQKTARGAGAASGRAPAALAARRADDGARRRRAERLRRDHADFYGGRGPHHRRHPRAAGAGKRPKPEAGSGRVRDAMPLAPAVSRKPERKREAPHEGRR